MDEPDAREMVDKNGGTGVSFPGKSSLELCEESHLRRFHLVDGDAFTRLGGDINLVSLFGFLAAPWQFSHCAEEATSTFWRGDLGKLVGDLSIQCHRLEGRE